MAKYISAKPTDTFINLYFGWIWLQDLSQGIVKNNVFCCQIVPKSPQTNQAVSHLEIGKHRLELRSSPSSPPPQDQGMNM